MYEFEEKKINELNIEEFNSFEDKNLFTTIEWLNFLQKEKDIQPLIVRITKDNKFIGYFTGGVIKFFGIKIVGSPFRGWVTQYMGLDLVNGANRLEILSYLWNFIKSTFSVLYMEIIDPHILKDDVLNTNYYWSLSTDLECSIPLSEEEIIQSYKKSCRNLVRQFARKGGTIKLTDEIEQFVNIYYKQLKEIFATQGLKPSYSKQLFKNLIISLKNIEKCQILLIEAFDKDKNCIGTHFGFAYNKYAYNFADSSDKACKHYNQGTFLYYTAMKYWMQMGYRHFDLMGVRPYKYRYNPVEVQHVRLIFTKFKFLIFLRNFFQKAYWFINSLQFKLKNICGK